MKPLWASIRNNFKLYRRNKLLLGAGLILLLSLPLMNSHLLFQMRDLDRFELVSQIFQTGNWLIYLFVGATGLITLSEPYRERSLKLILTRPFSLGAWLGSHFLSGLILAVGFHGSVGILTRIMCFFFSIEFYPAFWFLTLYWICSSVILFSVLMVLSLYMRPILAAFLAMIFNPQSLSYFSTMLIASSSAQHTLGEPSLWLDIGSYIVLGGYLFLPAYFPMSTEFSRVFYQFQLESSGDWWYLLPISGYALLMVALCFCFLLFVLRGRNLS